MNKLLTTTFYATLAVIISSSVVLADGLVFDPENYPVNTEVVAASNSANTNSYSPTGIYASKPSSPTKVLNDTTSATTRENNNMQKALFELDSSQADVRNQLIDARAI